MTFLISTSSCSCSSWHVDRGEQHYIKRTALSHANAFVLPIELWQKVRSIAVKQTTYLCAVLRKYRAEESHGMCTSIGMNWPPQ